MSETIAESKTDAVFQMKLLALRILHEFREGHEPSYEKVEKFCAELEQVREALRS